MNGKVGGMPERFPCDPANRVRRHKALYNGKEPGDLLVYVDRLDRLSHQVFGDF